MWIASKSDRLRGLTKNLSEFAREVVAPTYEDEDEPAPEDRPGSTSDTGIERYQALIRSLQDRNQALQEEAQSLRAELRAKKEECLALGEKCRQLNEQPLQRPLGAPSVEELQDKVVLLMKEVERHAAEYQIAVGLHQQTKQQLEQYEALLEKQRKELVQRAETSVSELKAQFSRHLRDLHVAVTGREPSASGSIHDQVDELASLLAGLKPVDSNGGHCTSPGPAGSLAPGGPAWPNSSQGSSTITEPEAEPLRATIRALRQENDGLKAQVAQLEVAQQGHEHQHLRAEQEWQKRLQLQEAAHLQQLQDRVHAVQQHHAQEKAAGHAELQRCTAELAEYRQRGAALEQQVQLLQQQLGSRRGQADLEDRYNEAQVIISRLTAQLREQTALAAVHQTNFQQEASELQQKLAKLQRQVAVLQQENQALRDSTLDSSKALDALESQREQFREQLMEKEEHIRALQAEVAEKESQALTHLTEVDNLNAVLEMFRREREAEVQSRLAGMRREVEEARQQAAEKERETQRAWAEQATLREEHERALQGRQRQVDCLEEKVQGLLATMEAQMKRMSDDNVIDKTLVNHLFLRYWNMRNDNNGVEVLKVMSKILSWDEAMQRKVGVIKSGGLWNAIFRPGAVDDDLPVTTPQDVAISDLWVNFLERQAASAPRRSSMEGIASDQLQGADRRGDQH